MESTIGLNTQFTGDIACKGTIHIEGKVTGNIEADWVMLGEKSSLRGNTKVGGMVISGNVEGNIIAREIVEIRKSGQIKGDVTTPKLVVMEGGVIDGSVTMKKEGSKVVELKKEAEG